jgi:hypothetical protein
MSLPVRALLLPLLLLCAASACVRTRQARITGTVTGEPHAAPVPEAVVLAQSAALPRERAAVTDAQGRYVLEDLPPGTYTVQFLGSRHDPCSQEGLRVETDAQVRLDVALKVAEPDAKFVAGCGPVSLEVAPPPVASPR